MKVSTSARGSVCLIAMTAFVACGGKTVLAPEETGVPTDTGTDTAEPLPDTREPPIDVTPIPDGPEPIASAKIDLLFVIDNSMSMADKQADLARRIPELIAGLTNPTSKKRATDLHVAVITSSLGSHGTSACDPSVTNNHNNDHGHLLPRAGEGGGSGWAVGADGAPTPAACPAPVTATALSWVADPGSDPKAMFSGSAGSSTLQTAASCVVRSAAEDGCGYEETLESMYHFLIDPAPYATAEVKCTFGVSGDACGSNKIEVKGLDTEILSQRAAFLRPDSSVVIVVLSDENDFSLKPASLNWLPWGYGAGQFQRGWKACEGIDDAFEPESASEFADLHAKNCYSCFENAADPGGNCVVPWPKDKLNNDPDGRNLRGFHMVQRFGYNFLWSRDRYVKALTKTTAIGSDGKEGPNPLFASGKRTPGNVMFAAIVGVPGSLVNDASGAPKPLTASDWNKIAGPAAGRDPHMVESIAPRVALGIKKFAGDRSIDPVNGGDRDVYDGDDLQYACIGLRTDPTGGYECSTPGSDTKNPLCGPSGKQPYFKAYPGLRHLRVARELGSSGFVASICDANLSGALRALVERVQPLLK